MEYMDKVAAMLKRYPHFDTEVKIYTDPSLSGIDHGWIDDLDTFYKEVNSPDDADYIPLWIDYYNKCSDKVIDMFDKYPKKCLSSSNLIDSIIVELPGFDKSDLVNITKMLTSPDWEVIKLGLCTLRVQQLPDEIKYGIVDKIVSSFQPDYNSGTGTIIPYGKKENDRISIDNVDIIRFFNLYLHNKLI